jgi:flagellar motor switch protein FliG
MSAIASTDYDAGRARLLTGADKVAALLLAMGKPLAARLLKHFDQIELRQITRAAAHLGAISSAMIDSLIEEFVDSFSMGVDLLGNAGEAEQLLNGALPPEQVADILSDVLGSSNSSLWEKLAELPEAVLSAYLEKEHPQTAAFILTKLNPACGAKIVSLLPRDLRNELLIRMIGPEPVAEEALRIVETTLTQDLLKSAGRAAGPDSRARIADIVNRLEPNEVEDVIQSLTEATPKDAAALKKMLFTFDDLLRLSNRARALLFDNAPTDTVVLALRGTEAEFRDAVLSSMASRARRLVESELNNGASVPQRDIAKARRTIADLVLRMVQRNEIELGDSENAEPA